MSNAVVTKQGIPSAPGTVVDTSTAAVVDILDPRVADAAERDAALRAQDEGKSVERKQDIAAKATAMTGTTTVADRLKEQSKQRSRKTPEQAAAEKARKAKNAKAVAGKGKGSSKAKPAAKRKATTGNTGNAFPRVTDSWKGKGGKEVEVKDHVTHGEVTGVVKGRWSRRKGDAVIPMVTLILDKPKDKDKPRHNAPAAECVHVK